MTLFRAHQNPNLPILAAKAGKGGYVEHCTVVRYVEGDGTARTEDSGPGTGRFRTRSSLHQRHDSTALVLMW